MGCRPTPRSSTTSWPSTSARYKFLVGVSLDGPEELHDRYRRTIDGRGSHAGVVRGLETLRRHKVEFNVLVLVNRENARRPAEIYRYLLDLGVTFHQYIPCVELDASGQPASPTASTAPSGAIFSAASSTSGSGAT